MALVTLVHLVSMGNAPVIGVGDDYALYVLHARNIVEGHPYGATGYIFNPLNPWFGPRAYPPGFPVLLAPVYAALGLDFRAMKVLVVLAFAGSLLALARLARRDLSPLGVYATLALVGLHPYLWTFREHLLPDLPFTFFCLLALFPIARAGAPGLTVRQRVAWGAAAVAMIVVATATRSIGVALVPTLLGVLVLRSRRPWAAALVCVAAGTVLGAAALVLGASGSGSLRQLSDLAASRGVVSLLPDVQHLRVTWYLLTDVWLAGQVPWDDRALPLAALLLAAAGLWPRLRRPGAAELFLLFYAATVFLWPGAQSRYYVPILPLSVLYAVIGAERLVRTGRPAARAIAALTAAWVIGAYAWSLAAWERPGDGWAGADEASAELYSHVHAHTPPDARFVTDLPRAFSLFTGRPAAPPSRRGEDQDALAFMDSVRIDYVALRVAQDCCSPGPVERNPNRFVRVFVGKHYEVYRLLPDAGAAGQAIRP